MQLRLADGATDAEGRLELLFQDEWAPLCGLGAGQLEAEVACRQLGFQRAAGEPGTVHKGPGAFVLDGLNCNGDEAGILDCFHEPLGWSSCRSTSALAIYCSNTSADPTTQSPGERPLPLFFPPTVWLPPSPCFSRKRGKH